MSFTVSIPAANRALMTLADIRQAIPSAADESDATVQALGLAVSDMVSRACRIRGDGVNPPTLLSEPILETFRLKSYQDALYLARRFVTAISSVVEDGVTLSADEYEVEKATGILTRLDENDEPISWPCGKIVVTYTAGFATVPGDLRLAAQAALREQWSAFQRDPLLRAETVDGVGSFTYWVNTGSGGSGGSVSDFVLGMLSPYRMFPV